MSDSAESRPVEISFEGRAVIVTGAARGIGAATARLFARTGADLAVCDRAGDDLAALAADLGAAGTNVVAEVLDVRDVTAVDRFVATTAARFGRIDVLVNNAGGTFAAPFLEVSAKGEGALVDANFGQVSHWIRAVAPHMANGGSIVNVTSVEAHQAAPAFAVYAAMKAAVTSLTKSLALELAPLGIRVNAMAPDALITDADDVLKDQLVHVLPGYRPATLPPLGHLGSPDDGAAAIAFLASDLARFTTGSTLHVDGGTHAAGGWHRQPDAGA